MGRVSYPCLFMFVTPTTPPALNLQVVKLVATGLLLSLLMQALIKLLMVKEIHQFRNYAVELQYEYQYLCDIQCECSVGKQQQLGIHSLFYSSPLFSFFFISKFKKCTDRPSLHLFWRGEKVRMHSNILGLMARWQPDRTRRLLNGITIGYSSFGNSSPQYAPTQLWCSYCSC